MNPNNYLLVKPYDFFTFSGLTGCYDNGVVGGSCCTSSNLCGVNEGDCDRDSDCFGKLKCGSLNCPKTANFVHNADCCYDPYRPRMRLTNNKIPEINYNGKWVPICGHWFWNGNHGAKLFCKRLGYASGVITDKRIPLSSDGFRIGDCSGTNNFPDGCTGGCHKR